MDQSGALLFFRFKNVTVLTNGITCLSTASNIFNQASKKGTLCRTAASVMLHLAFDELSHWPLAQLRRGALRDAERGCNHLSAGAVHADEVDQAGEILQEGEIS